MSHISKVLSIQFVTRVRVMEVLGWNELQYGSFQFDKGIEYLKHYCGDDEAIVSFYAKHSLYWKWFKNHWHNRDYDFLKSVKDLPQADKVAEYLRLHDMRGFRYKPHRIVMEMSMYDKVIYPTTHVEEVGV